jgi:hypothetical protein
MEARIQSQFLSERIPHFSGLQANGATVRIEAEVEPFEREGALLQAPIPLANESSGYA